jgi:hypothetical protein
MEKIDIFVALKNSQSKIQRQGSAAETVANHQLKPQYTSSSREEFGKAWSVQDLLNQDTGLRDYRQKDNGSTETKDSSSHEAVEKVRSIQEIVDHLRTLPNRRDPMHAQSGENKVDSKEENAEEPDRIGDKARMS